MTSRLSGKIALITGGGAGLGEASARRFRAEGASLIINDLDAARAERVAGEVGGWAFAADVSDSAAVARMFEAVRERHGRLDVLVNNAGIVARFPHADLKAATPEIWRSMFDVNVIAPWMLIAEAEAALRASATQGRPASIINIGTHAAVRPKGSSIPYAAAKAALHHATRLLALTLGPDIRVNCVAPGLVDTPMSTGWEAAYELWNTRSPMKRPAKPEDIADLVAALCANDYVTGEIVIADGGLNLT